VTIVRLHAANSVLAPIDFSLDLGLEVSEATDESVNFAVMLQEPLAGGVCGIARYSERRGSIRISTCIPTAILEYGFDEYPSERLAVRTFFRPAPSERRSAHEGNDSKYPRVNIHRGK
jgi:hypothetical protein